MISGNHNGGVLIYFPFALDTALKLGHCRKQELFLCFKGFCRNRIIINGFGIQFHAFTEQKLVGFR